MNAVLEPAAVAIGAATPARLSWTASKTGACIWFSCSSPVVKLLTTSAGSARAIASRIFSDSSRALARVSPSSAVETLSLSSASRCLS